VTFAAEQVDEEIENGIEAAQFMMPMGMGMGMGMGGMGGCGNTCACRQRCATVRFLSPLFN
jgi:hypothetical protein